MEEENRYKLDQVSVRLKLNEEAPLYSDKTIDSPNRAVEVMKEMMKELDREYVCIVNIDSSSHPINFNVVSIGSINASLVSMRELFKSAIMSNAASILLLHNHPSSSLKPSKEDHATTARVMMASELMGIPLLDHIIVGGVTGEYYSYKNEMQESFNMKGLQDKLKLHNMEETWLNEICDYHTCKARHEEADGGRMKEYNPLAKVEELEEQNYNMIDNRLNNIMPKSEEQRMQRQNEESEKAAEQLRNAEKKEEQKDRNQKIKEQSSKEQISKKQNKLKERRSVIEALAHNKAAIASAGRSPKAKENAKEAAVKT